MYDDRVQYVTFINHTKTLQFMSMNKFLTHLFETGHGMAKSSLKNRYISDRLTGTFTIGGEHWTFVSVYKDSPRPVMEPIKSTRTRTEDLTPWADVTHKVIHHLTPTHKLVLTMSPGNTLLHTKSIAI
ncbi:MAG TPA: hypothetical protein PKD51_11445 [Saprospiraceae bacterium]|nr:hypothetical protein [Saprospiraceae bacterium]